MKFYFVLKYLPFLFLPVAIISLLPYTWLAIDNTFFWWIVKAAILYVMVMSLYVNYDTSHRKVMTFISIYLGWNLLAFFHGFFMAEMYWDWKALINNTMGIMVPLLAFSATNLAVSQELLSKYMKWTFPFFPITIPFVLLGTWGEYLAPLTFFLFFLPVIPMRYKLIILAGTLAVVTSSLDSRSDIIKFSIPILLLVYYLFKKIPLKIAFELPRLGLMFAPIILFTLAISGIFNPFAMKDYAEMAPIETDRETSKEITADTRTGLYVEVIQSAIKHNSWLIGRSPARGNDTELFGNWMEGITGRRERYGNEASILNIFTWTGIIGVILYFLIFWRVTFLAIHRSNNIFAKMIGVYLAFRWLYAWVEDFNVFNLNYFTLWLMIGLCMSKAFRELTDDGVTIWARGIFDRRYKIKVMRLDAAEDKTPIVSTDKR